MVQVRIRHYTETESRLLGEVPLTSDGVKSVLDVLEAWGVIHAGEFYGRDEIQANFAVSGYHAFFEVVLGAEGSE